MNPSSGAPGNAYGHCKDNGNGHPNQQPAGCSTDTLAFVYEYDERGLIEQRDVASDEATTETNYAHDAVGRLTQSVTGSVATVYTWDAASNLVGESGTDDPSTSKTGDDYVITRTVNAANQLVSSVMTPVGTPGGKVETTGFSYDGRGNRTGSVTTTKTGNKTHTVASSSFVFDGMDQLISTLGSEGSASWVRDGMGRALTVTEDGVVSNRLYDGIQVVAEGDTQLTLAPNGGVLSETTTTTTVKGKNTTTTVKSVDVLTDVLGSAVATASDGVISADLALFGDFGDPLTTPKTDTVTGFTGKLDTAGLVEFAARTYDPATRQWVQDDRYRGTVTRAASMNRYAYVEGAPETFVDHLGYYRAAAALQAQQLASLNAELQSALGGLEGLFGAAFKYGQDLSVAQMLKIWDNLNAGLDPQVKAALDPIVRQLAYDVTQVHYQQKIQVALQVQAQKVAAAKLQQVALQIEARATLERDYYRAVAGMSVDPLAVPVQKSFLQNAGDFVGGYYTAAWDTAVGLYDMSMVSAVFTPGRYEARVKEVVTGFSEGVKENGWWEQATITLNPVYHVLDAGSSMGDAWSSGDYSAAGGAYFHTQMAVVEVAAVAIPGAQLVVGLGTKALTAASAATATKTATVAEAATAGTGARFIVGADGIVVDTATAARVAANTRLFPNLGPDDVIRPNGFRPVPNSQLGNISGRFNYTVLEDGRLVVGSTRYGHIDLANGAPVLAAGEVRIVNGRVSSINNASGHYRPSGTSAQTAAEDAFRSQGLDLTPGAYREIP